MLIKSIEPVNKTANSPIQTKPTHDKCYLCEKKNINNRKTFLKRIVNAIPTTARIVG
jgi:hypothetical protein